MFNNKYKNRIVELESQIDKLNNKLSSVQDIYKKAQDFDKIETMIEVKKTELESLEILCQKENKQHLELKDKIAQFNMMIDMQDICLYEPNLRYNDSEQYKSELKKCIEIQKQMCKNKSAIVAPDKNVVGFNGSKKDGNNIVSTIQNLMLIAFNSFCNETIDKCNCFCYDKFKQMIENKYEKLNSMGQILNIYISRQYFDLKIQQLDLETERKFIIEKEKEDRRHEQEILREQAKVDAEIEADKAKLLKEKNHYEIQIEKSKDSLIIQELNDKIKQIDEHIANDDYKLINQRAGYLYCIRNLDMKDGMVKIGITRRIEPMQRIIELSNASHAYKFDVYGMVFSDDVFGLETKMHQYFANKRVNQANRHKEFFEITLDEVKTALDYFGYKMQIDENPINEEYLLSEKMKGNLANEAI